MSIVPGFCLRVGVHKVPGVVQGHHLWFILPVGVHTLVWLLARICIGFEPCPWDFIYLWILVVLWISVWVYTLLYPCDYLGKNIWRPRKCIVVWCWIWRCLHAFSLWLSLMWVCWILLESLWDYLSQGRESCSVSFLFLWSDVTYCSRIGWFSVFRFVFV